MTLILILHTASTLAMTGLIWFVQLVHYPLFPYAAAGDFHAFAADHQRRTGWVVIPLMLTEAGTATLLLVSSGSVVVWIGWGLLVVVWLSTAFLQVPCHQRLAEAFDADTARRLVSTNWWRTIGWTGRACIALWLLTGEGLP